MKSVNLTLVPELATVPLIGSASDQLSFAREEFFATHQIKQKNQQREWNQ